MAREMQPQQQQGAHPVARRDHQAAARLVRACAYTSARSENGLWSSAATCCSSPYAQMLPGIACHSKCARESGLTSADLLVRRQLIHSIMCELPSRAGLLRTPFHLHPFSVQQWCLPLLLCCVLIHNVLCMGACNTLSWPTYAWYCAGQRPRMPHGLQQS